MAAGLLKASNYYNRIAAWRDFDSLAKQARKIGRDDLVREYSPLLGAGHRTIDKCTAKLRAALEEIKNESPAG